MPSPEHEGYRGSFLRWCRAHADEPDVAAQLKLHMNAVAILWELDLEPARPTLVGCYAKHARGGGRLKWDPVLLLRCLLLMILVGQVSKNKWAKELQANRVLRAAAGLPDVRRPGVGTFYDFDHRLHDGPIRTIAAVGLERPSEAERRRASSTRPQQAEVVAPPEPEKAAKPAKEKGKKARRQRRRDKAATKAPVVNDSAAAKVVAELEKTASAANPNDLHERLTTILLGVGVQATAARGLLGDVTKLNVCGDGSPLVTGTSGRGKRACDCLRSARCKCPRIYDDPDARFGWDHYREKYFFGYHFYELLVNVGGHDLPLALRLDPGQTSDFTASLHALDRTNKALAPTGMKIRSFIADAGHDGEANHRYLYGRDILAVIPLRGKAPATHPTKPDMTLSKLGIPTCQADAEMASRGSAGKDRKLFMCPVKAGTLATCPIAPPEDPTWTCRPGQPYGPVVTVDVTVNHRLFPWVPRNSSTYGELYRLRSGCERSNSVKKVTFKLEEARHRRGSFWLIRLHLIAVLQHARIWVEPGAPERLVAHLLGREVDAKTA